MSLTYKVKNFENIDSNKLVGLLVTDTNGKIFAIDKQIPLSDGKSDDSYVQDAITAATDEINEWQNQNSVIGKVFNIDTNTLEE
jgi:hypothetical protein